MKHLKKITTIFLLTVLALTFTACGSDDNDPVSGNNLGEIALTVSGEVNATYSGMMDFHHLTQGNIEIWDLSGHDYSPQTFSISFMLMGVTDEISQPATGTYKIGSPGEGSSVFVGNYTHIENEDYVNTIEYSSISGGGGTLTITISNADTIAGSFECTLVRTDDALNVVGSIQITGEFTAHPRQLL